MFTGHGRSYSVTCVYMHKFIIDYRMCRIKVTTTTTTTKNLEKLLKNLKSYMTSMMMRLQIVDGFGIPHMNDNIYHT